MMNQYQWLSMEATVERMLQVIDNRINKYYNYNECGVSVIAYHYIKKFLVQSKGYPRSQLKILCTTAYLLALKYLLDSAPTTNDYSKIVNVSSIHLIKKEYELGSNFKFNFTPMDINIETGDLTKL
jgi:hypothetical protein